MCERVKKYRAFHTGAGESENDSGHSSGDELEYSSRFCTRQIFKKFSKGDCTILPNMFWFATWVHINDGNKICVWLCHCE